MDEAGTRTEFLTRSHGVWCICGALLLLLTTIVQDGQFVLVRQLEEENLEVQHVEEETFSGMLSNLQKGTSQETTIVLDGQFVLVRQLEFQSDEYGWKHAPASKNYVEGDDL